MDSISEKDYVLDIDLFAVCILPTIVTSERQVAPRISMSLFSRKAVSRVLLLFSAET
jgi:hypothetical protein